ncbi:MAG: DUF2142 domain-containing protein [Methanobacteriaceae archaeon]|nr:DUF2142 domain-containing protein [Methanobacteriaceae archaeon]
MDKLRTIEPQKAFLFLGIFFGLIFSLLVPPFQINDEPAHYYKAYVVSEGQILPGKTGGVAGFYVPENLEKTVASFYPMIYHSEVKQNASSYASILNLPIYSGNRVYVQKEMYTLVYPPLPYAAAGLLMAVASIMGASPLALMYLGRIINLLIWVLMVSLAIKITPVHKWVFFLLALMPMTLFEAASLSADSFNLGLSFLTIAFFFKLAFEEEKKKVENRDLLILLALLAMLVLSKVGYALLLILFFLIPSYKFANKKIMVSNFLVLTLPVVLLAGIWNYLFKNLYVSMPPAWQTASIPGQLAFLSAHPLSFIPILGHTLMEKGGFLVSFVGIFGWNELPLPEIVVALYLIALVVVAVADESPIKINSKQRLVAFITFFTMFFLIIIYEYVTFTPVGLDIIYGVQGRYFIPVAPLLFLLFYTKKKHINLMGLKINLRLPEKSHIIIILFSIIIISISLFIIAKRYYAF